MDGCYTIAWPSLIRFFSLKPITLDRFAVALSGICILHCLFAPVALTLLPILSMSAVVEDLIFHELMLWLVLPTSIIALILGCRKHRKISILLSGFVGLSILTLVAVWGHDVMTFNSEKIATSAAGLLLAFSHFLNYRACQSIICGDENCQSKHHH